MSAAKIANQQLQDASFKLQVFGGSGGSGKG